MGWLRKVYSIQNPTLRDFSEREKERLLAIADDYDDFVEKYVTDALVRWFDKKGWLDLLSKSNQYQKIIFEAYNINSDAIKKIFDAARRADGLSGSKINNLQKQMQAGVTMIKNLSKCFCMDNRFDCHAMEINVLTSGGDEYYTMWDLWRKSQIRKITDDNIREFCGQNLSTIFSDFSDEICMDLWGCTTLELSNLKFGYGEKEAKKALSEIIESAIDTYDKTETFVKDHEQAKKALEKLYESYEKKDKEKFEKENPGYKYSDVEKFMMAIGGVNAFKFMLDKCPQWLDYMMTDYSKGLQILDNMDSLLGKDVSPEMQSAISSLQRDYEEKSIGYLNKCKDDILEFIGKNGGKEVTKWITEKYDSAYILSSVIDITGVEDITKTENKLFALASATKETEKAFLNAVEKIQSGNYTDSDLKKVKDLFEVNKQANIKLYESYREYYETKADSLKRIYANEQLERLNKMTLTDYYNNLSKSYK